MTYMPAANQHRTAVVTVTDDGGTATGGVNTTSRSFTVTVNSVNDTPTLVQPIADITVDAGTRLTVVALFPYCDDPDITTSGDFTYDPDDTFAGIDTFTYKFIDGSLHSNVATVTIQVTNNLPEAHDNLYRVIDGDTLNVSAADGLLVNDSDPDAGDSLTVGAYSSKTGSPLGVLTRIVVNDDVFTLFSALFWYRSCKHLAPKSRHPIPSGLIGRFQRHWNVDFRRQEERHLGQLVSDTDRFDECFGTGASQISDTRQWLAFRQSIVFAAIFAPNLGVNALRVARTGWEQIDDQHVNPSGQGFTCLAHKRIQAVSIIFVTRRNDLHQRDHLMPAHVTNGHSKLRGQGVIPAGQETPIHRARDLGDPEMIEGVKNARIDARPVVDRHQTSFTRWPTTDHWLL